METTGQRLVSISTLTTGSAIQHLMNVEATETIIVTKFTAQLKSTRIVGTIVTPPAVVGDVKNKVIGTVTTKKSSGVVTGTVLTGEIGCKQ